MQTMVIPQVIFWQNLFYVLSSLIYVAMKCGVPSVYTDTHICSMSFDCRVWDFSVTILMCQHIKTTMRSHSKQ